MLKCSWGIILNFQKWFLEFEANYQAEEIDFSRKKKKLEILIKKNSKKVQTNKKINKNFFRSLMVTEKLYNNVAFNQTDYWWHALIKSLKTCLNDVYEQCALSNQFFYLIQKIQLEFIFYFNNV